jgi:hypothetical protein
MSPWLFKQVSQHHRYIVLYLLADQGWHIKNNVWNVAISFKEQHIIYNEAKVRELVEVMLVSRSGCRRVDPPVQHHQDPGFEADQARPARVCKAGELPPDHRSGKGEEWSSSRHRMHAPGCPSVPNKVMI